MPVPSMISEYRDTTIMVVMPHPWKGGFFRVAASVCNALNELTLDGSRFRIILGVPEGYDCTERYLLNPDVSVEQIGYEAVDVYDARFVDPEKVDRLIGLPLLTPSRTLPYGDTGTIGEVDAFILLSALYPDGVFVTRKPYAVFVADMIQRYVPEIYSDGSTGYEAAQWKMDRNQRVALKEADCVFSTTTQTMKDVLHYGGVAPEKTMLFPMFAIDIANHQAQALDKGPKHSFELNDLISGTSFRVGEGGYFLWVTNASAHKNHVSAFRALRHYYEALGGELKCLICGPVTDMLVPGRTSLPYHSKVYEEIQPWKSYNKYVKVLGYLTDSLYLSLLGNARFLWHNVIYDNGSFSIIEASSVGTPVLTSSYPQIRVIDQQFGVKSEFFDPYDPIDTALKIREMDSKPRRKRPRAVNGSESRLLKYSLVEMLRRICGRSPSGSIGNCAGNRNLELSSE